MLTRRTLHSRALRAAALGLAATAALGLGCGKNRIILDVDVRSFMKASDLTQSYAAPPGVPASLRLPPVSINLVEGYKDFGKAEDVPARVIEANGLARTGTTLYASVWSLNVNR